MSSDQQEQNETIASRLRPAHVAMRADLEVHRHVFRDEVSYVFRDPMTLAVHKVGEADYQLCAAITDERSLGEIFDSLVEEGLLEEDDEEDFFQFILGLHGLGFLNLPVPDDKSLYRRRQAKLKAVRSSRKMAFLFLQVPLFNPDAFLDRTKHFVSWMFTKWALMVWMAVVGSALYMLVKNWDTFFTPLGNVFTPERLIGLWLALVSLKLIHEFGHAYACKILGGEVPEMGAYFIAGTPCAYVDATASWGFSKRSERLTVVLAGVYVELFIAALAVFVWAIAPTATIQLFAFDIVVVAGIATVIANLNPLMRFDGYYIASDLLEIPNLRSTAQKHAIAVFKHILLGVPMPHSRFSFPMRTTLFIFGIMTALYKISIVMGISAMLSTKYLYLGIGLAAMYGGKEFYRVGKNVGNYLIHSDEARMHRVRAGVLATLVFGALPLFLVLVPVPRQVMALGVVGMEQEHVCYASQNGFIDSIDVYPGDVVDAEEPMAQLENPSVEMALDEAQRELETSRIRADALMQEDPAAASIERQNEYAAIRRIERERSVIESLTIRAEEPGVVLQMLPMSSQGQFINQGQQIARVGSGRWVVRGLVRATSFARVGPKLGDEVTFRSISNPEVTVRAKLVRIADAGNREIPHETLTATAGGEIPISPVTGKANEPYFQIEAMVIGDPPMTFGSTGKMRIGTHREPIATSIWRSALRLLQRLEEN
ncbi:MAG TPA: HlyD family efflux transporter periplasmic adaptor subunit [Phycisphaerales bacterium]|nr:HlyD family efflux transporter periplasmic adaptor subunit [Phycisphaerales bacterium]